MTDVTTLSSILIPFLYSDPFPSPHSDKMKIFTTSEIKAIERYTMETEHITSLDLIERAAEAIASEIMSRWRPGRPITIFAGQGNNGADALTVGSLLIAQGYTPRIILFNINGNRLSPECKACRDAIISTGYTYFTEVINKFQMPELTRHDVVIDGLFGTGLSAPLEGGFVSLVGAINESKATVVSIDIPSGLSGDWNPRTLRRNVIRAHLTLAIQFPHLCFFLPDYADLVGEWKVIDIGLSADAVASTPSQFYLVEQDDVRRILRRRRNFSSKADYGSALLYAGTYGMMGAAVMAARGALRSGVGKLTVSSPMCGYQVLQSAVPEALYQFINNDATINEMRPRHLFDSIAIGPGIGTADVTVKALEDFLASATKPVILDADALNCMALKPSMLSSLPVLSIITPHEGEFDRLFGQQSSGEARLRKALEMARYYNIIIVLKGHYTAIVRPDEKIYFNSSGTPALATAGSGDVLTGILVSLMAQNYPPEHATLMAVFIHGVAGEMAAELHGEYGVIASDIADNVGRAIKEMLAGK